MRHNLLLLQIRNNFFHEALTTWSLLEETGDTDGLAMFGEAVQAVEAIKFDETEYTIHFF